LNDLVARSATVFFLLIISLPVIRYLLWYCVFSDSSRIFAKTLLNRSVVYGQSVSPTEAEVVAADVLFASSADDHWSVLEEDMLLDAVEHHGFGSWLVSFICSFTI